MMRLSSFYTVDTWITCTVQFSVMMVSIVIGRWLAKKRNKAYAENLGNAAVATTLYSLLGLLMAFTFNMAAERFKIRKQVIITESNHISTAIYRTQLYADSVQPGFKTNFRHYLEARIDYYEAYRDTLKIQKAIDDADVYGRRLWAIAALHSRINGNLSATNQMTTALNNMFDTANTRFWGEYERTPASILTLLFLLSMTAAFMIGYTSVEKGLFDWIRAVFFCSFTSLVIYFIIDLDRPRSGVINLDHHQKAITNLRGLLD
jgi:hypothetical protein